MCRSKKAWSPCLTHHAKILLIFACETIDYYHVCHDVTDTTDTTTTTTDTTSLYQYHHGVIGSTSTVPTTTTPMTFLTDLLTKQDFRALAAIVGNPVGHTRVPAPPQDSHCLEITAPQALNTVSTTRWLSRLGAWTLFWVSGFMDCTTRVHLFP